tara:strand:- start:1092 stop:1268 length:177 start_codon:yes stop_codon:yes gene_type:complete
VKFLCLKASKINIAAALDRFKESISPFIGIFTFLYEFSDHSLEIPLSSVPIIKAQGLE